MAADVSSLVRLLNGYNDDRTVAKESSNAKSTSAPMTRDLLGGSRGGGGDRSLELDLDLQVPTGWEKRLDLKAAKPLLNLFDDTTPELKLLPPSRSSRPLSLSPNRNFQSVCTLDKVKSALERAERDPVMFKKRQSPDDHHNHHRTTEAASPVAAGCPGCLSYVLVMKNNPRCPRCDTVVSLPTNASSMKKKVKIDLNISI
ncbi:hypothetical protein Bca4012_040365 [Brassica carinata]